MNFYHFNIGDYAGKTRHLSWDEDMAYRRLLDAYYSSEAPLPSDPAKVYRLAGAQSAKQKQAVNAVLDEFFERAEDGWRNSRCDEEIAKAAEKKGKAAEAARTRWEAQKALQDRLAAQSVGNAEAMRTHNEGNAPSPSPSPSPNIDRMGEDSARDPGTHLEATLRRAAGWENHPAPKLAVTGPIRALISAGADLELDVVPVIRALAPKVRSPGWTYFVNAIAQARDDRITAATVVSQPKSKNGATHAPSRGKPSRSAIFDAIHARLDRAERGAEADGSREPGDPAEGPT